MKNRTTDAQLEVMTRLGINDKIKAVARELRAARHVVAAAETVAADLEGNADSRVRGDFIMIEKRRVDRLLDALGAEADCPKCDGNGVCTACEGHGGSCECDGGGCQVCGGTGRAR